MRCALPGGLGREAASLFCEAPTTQFYTLSLHDALPILTVEFAPPNEFGVLDHVVRVPSGEAVYNPLRVEGTRTTWSRDRKSTRLNSSHPSTSYAVFCLKKKIGPVDPVRQPVVASDVIDL